MNQISLEQEAQIVIQVQEFKADVALMDGDTAREELKLMYEMWVRREAQYKHQLAKAWGMK